MRRRLAAIVASVVAVIAVLVVIVVVQVSGGSSKKTALPTPPTSPTQSVTMSVTPSVTPTTKPKPKPKPTAVRTTPKPVAVVTPSPAATPIAVYNVSFVSGRARLAGSRLRADGYPVIHQADRSFDVGVNLVWYQPGSASSEAAALGLVARHLGITIAAPRPASVPASGALIVVVTASYR